MDSHRRKPSRGPLIVITALIAASIACDNSDSALSARIVKAANVTGDAPLKLVDLTSFSWDRFFVFSTYETKEAIEKELGFSWSGADRIEMYDNFTLLVFVKANKVVRFVEHGRGPGGLSGCRRHGGYSPGDAIIVCPKDKRGYAYCHCQGD